MSGDIDLRPYLVPLVICKRNTATSAVQYDLERYAGVAFFVDNNPRVVTCRHIVESVMEGEELCGLDLTTNQIYHVSDIRTHNVYDFATGTFPMPNRRHFALDNKTIFGPGSDIQAMGFINNGKSGKDINVKARLHKGYVVCADDKPATADSRSTLEVSFPSHKGFSGTPLICMRTKSIAGMLFSNAESSIETHKYVEVSDQGHEYAEGIYRIVELGLAHSNQDVLSFLRDMQ